MSVLRRILAMRAAHAGWPGPGLPRSASLRDLVDCHRGAVLAQLAPPLAEPVDQLLAGVVAGTGAGSGMTARRSAA